ncbi:hypothetical protein [Brachybacterium sacelli]|uniref:Uncharacterized protein n=1 Tax=Brachybacterium sacelli TaxID=173364 RepID=A0ABS4X648_9MICO|nr:hypothetical protein [Brachybacterium sacelli]
MSGPRYWGYNCMGKHSNATVSRKDHAAEADSRGYADVFEGREGLAR